MPWHFRPARRRLAPASRPLSIRWMSGCPEQSPKRIGFAIAAIAHLYYRLAERNIVAMNTLTIKIPPRLEAEMLEASTQEHLSKSELVRRALETYLRQRKSTAPAESVLDRAGDLVGCFGGGPDDLASNPDHLADFGRV